MNSTAGSRKSSLSIAVRVIVGGGRPGNDNSLGDQLRRRSIGIEIARMRNMPDFGNSERS